MFFYHTDKNAGEIAEEIFSMISEGILDPRYEKPASEAV
jgi:hypothetical protein